MAILVKRKAQNPVPDYRQMDRLGTEGAASRAPASYLGAPTRPVTSVIAQPGANAPSKLTTPTTPTAPTSAATGSTSTLGTGLPSQPATGAVTSIIKPGAGAAAPAQTPSTITSAGSGATKPTTTTNNSTSNNALANTLLTTAGGALAGSLLNQKTGKSITDYLGFTGKPSAPVAPPQKAPVVDAVGKPVVRPPAVKPTGTASGSPSALDPAQQQQALDKASAEAQAAYAGPPEGSVRNPDGTYYNIDSNGFKTTYDAEGKTIAMEMGTPEELQNWAKTNNVTINTVKPGENGGVATGQLYTPEGPLTPKGLVHSNEGPAKADVSSMTSLGGGYYQAANGDVYDESGTLLATTNENGEYTLLAGDNQNTAGGEYEPYIDDQGNTWLYTDAGGWSLQGGSGSGEDTQVADNSENTWVDPDTGAVWTYSDNGWSTDWTDPNSDTQYASNEDENYYDTTAKNGGLITMMKKGGNVQHFDTGGYVDNGDGTYQIGNNVYDMATNDKLYSLDGETVQNVNDKYVYYGGTSPDPLPAGARDNGDETYTLSNGITYSYYNDMPLYGEGTNGQIIRPVDNGDGTYSVGNTTYDMNTNQPLYSSAGGSNGVAVYPSAIKSSGGSNIANSLVQAATPGNDTGTLKALQGVLGNSGVQGALLGTLFGQLLSGAGGTQAENKGVDMSKVGAIKPRTTEFGIGAPRVVSAGDYANPINAGGDIYGNTDLYYNLNAPGFNPVNPPAEAPAQPPAPADATQPVQPKADGGLATHYTFGKAVDPAEIMGGGGQGMRRGGLAGLGSVPTIRRFSSLPHPDNPAVGTVDGRHDYRNGAAVRGPGTGQSDDIPAMLADGEYVIDAELVSMLGDGSNKAGAEKLDKFREEVRKHKRSTPLHKIPRPAKSPLAYMKGIK